MSITREIKDVATLTDGIQANISRSTTEFRISWMTSIYDELKKDRIDPEPAIRRAIWKCGEIRGKNYKVACTNPDDCRGFADIFLSELGGKTFEKEIVEMRESKVLVDFHYCSLLITWKRLGFDDETYALFRDIAMDGNHGIAEGMGLQLDLTETLAKGCPTCKLRLYK